MSYLRRYSLQQPRCQEDDPEGQAANQLRDRSKACMSVAPGLRGAVGEVDPVSSWSIGATPVGASSRPYRPQGGMTMARKPVVLVTGASGEMGHP
jgi:hypothetical protein